MILLEQQKSNLIGSKEAILALEKKERAAILLVSDTHGRRDILRAILERFGSGCDALCFCGDGIADLCGALFQVAKSKKFSGGFPQVVAFVRGNGDYPIFPADFGSGECEINVPLHQTLKVCGIKILLTHGHSEGAYYGLERLCQAAAAVNADVVFYGHTHIAKSERQDLIFCINPGSPAHPRGGQKPSFAIVEIAKNGCQAEAAFFCVRQSFSEGTEFFSYTPERYF